MTETKITETKTIAVVGAAGATGGGLARAILADPEGGYSCRAITRTPDSAAARTLADRGATVVRADLDDVDSLISAFDGAYGAFCLTSFFEHFDAEREATQAANLARAAATAGVRHAIWSTAEDTRRRYPLDRRPDADAAGPVQGAAVGREVRRRCAVRRGRRPYDVPTHPVPLGGLGVRARSPAARTGRRAHRGDADRRRAVARHRRRGHRPVRVRGVPRRRGVPLHDRRDRR